MSQLLMYLVMSLVLIGTVDNILLHSTPAQLISPHFVHVRWNNSDRVIRLVSRQKQLSSRDQQQAVYLALRRPPVSAEREEILDVTLSSFSSL